MTKVCDFLKWTLETEKEQRAIFEKTGMKKIFGLILKPCNQDLQQLRLPIHQWVNNE